MASIDHPDLDIREKIVHIDQMLADIDRTFSDRRRIDADIDRIDADRDRKRQEIFWAPVLVVISALTAGAALFAAGAAFTKIFLAP